MKRKKTIWSTEMIQKLMTEFPNRFSRDIGKDLGISIRTVIRKARELGLEKEDSFLDKNRELITQLATDAHPPNPNKGNKDFRIPGGEKFQFKKGQPRPSVDYNKIHQKRNETIRKERIRIKYGLPQKTKLNLKNY